ncbi:HC-toxin synthetase [Pseudozyma hubeiensis SY62]|uniref:HC-toxin synthetase n=1 Tax=Pseudozyma hubeiensis (strain SY62) TaxID=1305764 RepID=R9PD14_PSEHS|nr:HC-toxin synthetase [Pseudozyma hubeiensis SY62]GAC99273.1 HC-toxin synthetase [Pseudozyma hubeiensis SY62]
MWSGCKADFRQASKKVLEHSNTLLLSTFQVHSSFIYLSIEMSSKNKLSKFKNAVAASSASSSPSASRSSSPKPSPSSSRTEAISTSQANTLQALHQEHLARISSTTLPNLASSHSRRFLRFARAQTQTSDAMWSTQKIHAVKYRRSLWAEDIEPEAEVPDKEIDRKVVPDFYHKHNPRCSRCALPLVPGLNQITLKARTARIHKVKKVSAKNKTRKRVSSCTLCHHKTWSS